MLSDTAVNYLNSKATPEQVSFMAFISRKVAEITEHLNGRNGRLLVVSADKEMSKTLRNYLTVLHFSVDVAPMGTAALGLLDKYARDVQYALARKSDPPEDYRMVLLDDTVGDIDPFQLKNELRELGSSAVVASIGGQKDADVNLSRPLDLSNLRAVLTEMFSIT